MPTIRFPLQGDHAHPEGLHRPVRGRPPADSRRGALGEIHTNVRGKKIYKSPIFKESTFLEKFFHSLQLQHLSNYSRQSIRRIRARFFVQAAAECGGISLVGSSYDGVGVNDSILSARKAVEEIYKPKEEFDW